MRSHNQDVIAPTLFRPESTYNDHSFRANASMKI